MRRHELPNTHWDRRDAHGQSKVLVLGQRVFIRRSYFAYKGSIGTTEHNECSGSTIQHRAQTLTRSTSLYTSSNHGIGRYPLSI
jgi:hypothetical protein